jgi:hypothetical protein
LLNEKNKTRTTILKTIKMKPKNDDPKGKKKKLFESSGSPSKSQSRAQGPAVAAATALGTAATGLILNRKKKGSKPDKLERLSEEQGVRAAKKANRASRIEEKRPVKAATLRAKATVLSKKSEANKKAAKELKQKK